MLIKFTVFSHISRHFNNGRIKQKSLLATYAREGMRYCPHWILSPITLQGPAGFTKFDYGALRPNMHSR